MSCAPLNPYPEAANFRRAPSEVMTLARMGSAHPTRLSFLRTMLRRMSGDDWRFERSLWQVDSKGVGRAVYRAIGPDRIYSLVAFSHDLPPEMRSDRVIATAWDATFTLFDGTPTEADLDRLQCQRATARSRAHFIARIIDEPRQSLGPPLRAYCGQPRSRETTRPRGGRRSRIPHAHDSGLWIGQIWRGGSQQDCRPP